MKMAVFGVSGFAARLLSLKCFLSSSDRLNLTLFKLKLVFKVIRLSSFLRYMHPLAWEMRCMLKQFVFRQILGFCGLKNVDVLCFGKLRCISAVDGQKKHLRPPKLKNHLLEN
jgi:hypothetical protein